MEVVSTDMVVLFSRSVSESVMLLLLLRVAVGLMLRKEGGCALIYIFLAQLRANLLSCPFSSSQRGQCRSLRTARRRGEHSKLSVDGSVVVDKSIHCPLL